MIFNEIVAETSTLYLISDSVNTTVAGVISKLVASDITLTIITTIVGIVAGAACSFSKRFWRNFTFIVSSIVIDLYLFARWVFASGNKYENWYDNVELWIFVGSVILSIILCLFGILFLRQKDIVSRKRIGKMIEKFTESADPNQPICIFAGDINFFGNYIKSDGNNKKRAKKRKNENIENNTQCTQLERLKCRDICVLCIKPPDKNEDTDNRYQNDRVRIGYLASKFGNVIHFKFVNDKCHNCYSYSQTGCTLLQCTKCAPGVDCPRSGNTHTFHSLPDTTLRGRIVTNRETGAKCVAITTKRSSGKDYILRQYGAGEKESSLYDVIWKVWWKECPEDPSFIKDCIEEYNDAKK